MCDGEIHVGAVEDGLVEDWRLSRRAFVAAGLAAGLASAADAAEDSVVETDVMVPTAAGMADAALFHPAGKGPWPAVLMWPDIMGLRPAFRAMGRRLAAAGYVVLVPNPFYRSKRAPVIDGSLDFSDPKTRQTLMGYRQAITDADIDGDATAMLAFLDKQPQTATKRKAGVQGYCMAGPFAFRTAAILPGRIAAVGSFHGGGLVTDKPDSPHLLIPNTHANYVVAIAQNDDAREPQSKNVLKQSFAAAHLKASVDVYPANHGWCVPGSQVYDQAAAEKAWAALLALYKTSLA